MVMIDSKGSSSKSVFGLYECSEFGHVDSSFASHGGPLNHRLPALNSPSGVVPLDAISAGFSSPGTCLTAWNRIFLALFSTNLSLDIFLSCLRTHSESVQSMCGIWSSKLSSFFTNIKHFVAFDRASS